MAVTFFLCEQHPTVVKVSLESRETCPVCLKDMEPHSNLDFLPVPKPSGDLWD